MLNKLKFFCVGLAAFIGAAQADAQFALSAGVSFPGSAYTDNGHGNYYSQLRIGADIGAQYNLALTERLDATGSVNLIRHTLGKMARNEMGYNYSVYPSYVNCAMMLGAAYKIDFEGEGFLNPGHHAFIDARLGANYSNLSRAVHTSDDGSEHTTRYDGAWRFCWAAGVGIRFSEKSSISLRYLDLGDVQVSEKGNADSRVSYTPRMVELLYSYWF